jgi:hypothetical protein
MSRVPAFSGRFKSKHCLVDLAFSEELHAEREGVVAVCKVKTGQAERSGYRKDKKRLEEVRTGTPVEKRKCTAGATLVRIVFSESVLLRL